MHPLRTTPHLLLSTTCVLILSACGGGSGSAGDGGNAVMLDDNGCALTGSVFSFAGNTAQIDSVKYAADAITVLSSHQSKFFIKDGANFRGENNLLEIASDSTVTFSNAPENSSLANKTLGPFNVKAYFRTTPTHLLGYGYVNTSAAGAVSTYFTPATSALLAPVLNTPYTHTYTTTTEATSTASESNTSQIEETSYLGVESVSVLAGTYTACKIKTQTTTNGVTDTSYKWTVASGRLKGLTVLNTDATGKKTSEAKVLLVNGS